MLYEILLAITVTVIHCWVWFNRTKIVIYISNLNLNKTKYSR